MDLLANEIGAYRRDIDRREDRQHRGRRAGEHFLDIQASGPWNVTIEQPCILGAALPQTLSGSGPEARSPSPDLRVAVFNMTHWDLELP